VYPLDSEYDVPQETSLVRVLDRGVKREFIALAEQISGQDLDDLFQTWLFTPVKPVLDAAPFAAARTASAAAATSVVHRAPAAARSELQRYGVSL
jgi:hypothetical protein